MPVLSPLALYAAAFLLVTNVIAVVMWRGEVAAHRHTKLAHAEQIVKAREEQLAYIQEAINFNDVLVAQLSEYEKQLGTKEKERSDAVRKLTSGRKCLDAAVVRVLNDVPGPPDGQAEPYPLSKDGSFATDTDVGEWASHAKQQYDVCRGRIDAIADFYEGLEAKR